VAAHKTGSDLKPLLDFGGFDFAAAEKGNPD